MNIESQIIFFFSVLGAFNGLVLSLYTAVSVKNKKFSNYFLPLLLSVLSIRVIKSAFFYFNPGLSGVFIQIGLSACILIGPFLYLYLKSYSTNKLANWAIHILPFLIGITILGLLYPYTEYRATWRAWIVKSIYLQWFVYLLFSFQYVKPIFLKLKGRQSLKNIDFWLLSIYGGVFMIWAAYSVGAYTSYLVGSLSSTFVLFLIVLLFIFRNNKNSTFFQAKEKYQNKEVSPELLTQIEAQMPIIQQKELYLNPHLTLEDVSQELNIPKHTLSQYLNEQLGKSFTNYINAFRIEKAKQLLHTNHNYTIEGLGYESGFNSKSTFFTAFKKHTGETPSAYRKNSLN